jgi:hypothetical protein
MGHPTTIENQWVRIVRALKSDLHPQRIYNIWENEESWKNNVSKSKFVWGRRLP